MKKSGGIFDVDRRSELLLLGHYTGERNGRPSQRR